MSNEPLVVQSHLNQLQDERTTATPIMNISTFSASWSAYYHRTPTRCMSKSLPTQFWRGATKLWLCKTHYATCTMLKIRAFVVVWSKFVTRGVFNAVWACLGQTSMHVLMRPRPGKQWASQKGSPHTLRRETNNAFSLHIQTSLWPSRTGWTRSSCIKKRVHYHLAVSAVWSIAESWWQYICRFTNLPMEKRWNSRERRLN